VHGKDRHRRLTAVLGLAVDQQLENKEVEALLFPRVNRLLVSDPLTDPGELRRGLKWDQEDSVGARRIVVGRELLRYALVQIGRTGRCIVPSPTAFCGHGLNRDFNH
jgi:hypothetical protein